MSRPHPALVLFQRGYCATGHHSWDRGRPGSASGFPGGPGQGLPSPTSDPAPGCTACAMAGACTSFPPR